MSKKIELVVAQDYLNPFAAVQNPRLCPELSDYLTEEARNHPNLSMEINCPAEEQERLCKAISNTFGEKHSRLKTEILLLRLQGLVLLALGVALAITAEFYEVEGTVPLGIVTITAWMLTWRTGEIFLLDIRAGYRDLRMYQRIINAPKQFI